MLGEKKIIMSFCYPEILAISSQGPICTGREQGLKKGGEHEQFPLTASNIEAGVSSSWLQPLRL
ncbi:hypothetical protein I314_01671 [Cryptococcus bacillisporus CA1873]|uniref:Uncharacterized protein n=1 Tax=Cryptococcus bacillisporus CA1873 TaxID=1296111 RepID=A0ABR5BGA3_CRYGA|nr:hypothetical protein I314_01671 [Cryptococcus bacillisporus CA1873]|eukprot:KIR68177.1 hypothetical protein I314_01671 [Cryptococcus gattii CA1873]